MRGLLRTSPPRVPERVPRDPREPEPSSPRRGPVNPLIPESQRSPRPAKSLTVNTCIIRTLLDHHPAPMRPHRASSPPAPRQPPAPTALPTQGLRATSPSPDPEPHTDMCNIPRTSYSLTTQPPLTGRALHPNMPLPTYADRLTHLTCPFKVVGAAFYRAHGGAAQAHSSHWAVAARPHADGAAAFSRTAGSCGR